MKRPSQEIEKKHFSLPPNLTIYEEDAKRFRWEAARAELDGLPGGKGINMAHDEAAVLASVARTRRAIIVDEGWRSGSLAAEISARITEGCFYDLDAPVARVCSAEVPSPYAWHLEQAALPKVSTIVEIAGKMLKSDG